MNHARVVAAGYDEVAEEYAALEAGSEWPRMRWLRDLLPLLPDGASVLDLGCGNGVPADRELARRHRVLGVDVSARQVELARSNVPEAQFVQADMFELDFPPDQFDAIVSFYAIGHIPRARHPELLRRLHRWLKPNGWLLLSEEDEDRPDTFGEWLGVPMFLSGHDASTLRRLVEEAGFAIARTAVESQREQGVDVPFTWILARKVP